MKAIAVASDYLNDHNIYGLGESAGDALENAEKGGAKKDSLRVLLATERLTGYVEKNGTPQGWCDGHSWRVTGGVADLVPLDANGFPVEEQREPAEKILIPIDANVAQRINGALLRIVSKVNGTRSALLCNLVVTQSEAEAIRHALEGQARGSLEISHMISAKAQAEDLEGRRRVGGPPRADYRGPSRGPLPFVPNYRHAEPAAIAER